MRKPAQAPIGWKWPTRGSIEVLDINHGYKEIENVPFKSPEQWYAAVKQWPRPYGGNRSRRYLVNLVDADFPHESDIVADTGGAGGGGPLGHVRYLLQPGHTRKNPRNDSALPRKAVAILKRGDSVVGDTELLDAMTKLEPDWFIYTEPIDEPGMYTMWIDAGTQWPFARQRGRGHRED